MFDTEQFIVEIESRPWLWNTNLDDYSNKIVRHESWIEIANAMFKDEWDSYQDGERACKIRLLQKKWKGLRDYFTRERNNFDKKGQKKRIPHLLNMLQFLKETKARKNDSADEVAPTALPRMLRAKKRPITPPPPKRSHAEADNTDPNMSFLLTILGDMRSMNERQNFEFRFEVMNLIKKIKYDVPARGAKLCVMQLEPEHELDTHLVKIEHVTDHIL